MNFINELSSMKNIGNIKKLNYLAFRWKALKCGVFFVMGCEINQKPTMSHRRRLWLPEEDQRLKNYILKHGHVCRSQLPTKDACLYYKTSVCDVMSRCIN
ncbi:Myb-related protein 308-like isoform X1 [Canna indica]|uniref:Myb-related protein 308-like isoform X1 n=1 Tax=Canna indica TaxID=4628 RepID=A0AAQ3QCK9_9LILI|nr:Myb-related protein 308-like isoform X1 [Canna indica]